MGLFKNMKVKKEKNTLEHLWSLEDKNDFIIELDTYIVRKCKYGESLSLLNEYERVFFLCQQFEKEVNNGGFNQYYFNSSGENCYETVQALKEIKTTHTAKLLEDANSLFGAEIPKDREKRMELVNNLSETSVGEQWENLDGDFFKYNDDLLQLNYDYVQAHKDFFINS